MKNIPWTEEAEARISFIATNNRFGNRGEFLHAVKEAAGEELSRYQRTVWDQTALKKANQLFPLAEQLKFDL